MQYTDVSPSYQMRTLIDLAVRVGAGILGCALLDNVRTVMPDIEGHVSGPDRVHGWSLTPQIFLVNVEGRPPRDLVATILHELSHLSEASDRSISEILDNKETSEANAQAFAEAQVKDWPTYYGGLIATLERRLAVQRYPEQHAVAMIRAR